MLYDAHNHLQDAWLAPHRNQVFADLATLPLGGCVVNGTCESDWRDVAALAEKHPFVFPSYGLHPWNVGNASSSWKDALQRILDETPHAAIGEIGLDRWMLDRARPDDPRLAGLRRAPLDQQLDAFSWQLSLAAERNIPVSIHCIDAWGALSDALRASARPARGFLLHAYGGSAESAKELAGFGAFFSFNGYFLGERQAAKRAVFTSLPANRVLVETDAPAMPPPAEYRAFSLPGFADGTPINHPGNIREIYAAFAKLRGLALDVLTAHVADNFTRLFGTHL